MTTNKVLREQIKLQTSITKLQTLKDTGLDKMITIFDDFEESDKTELIPVIDARIAELQA